MLGDNGGELEYVVDRRRLGRVDVLERFPQTDGASAGELNASNDK
jgi:hypothetical protein